MRHTDSQLVSGHNIDSGHKIAAGGPTHTGTPAAARLSICQKRTDARKAAACISFRPARRPPPQSWRRHEGPDPYTTHGRTRNQSVRPTQTSGTAALVRAARACDRPGLPQLCSSAPALPSVVPSWRTVSTTAEEWIPLIETPAPAAGRAYEYCSCNKLRTREEGANAAQQSAARGCPTRNVHSTAPNARNWSLGSCR